MLNITYMQQHQSIKAITWYFVFTEFSQKLK